MSRFAFETFLYIDPRSQLKLDKNFYNIDPFGKIYSALTRARALSSVISIIYARIMENGTSGTRDFPLAGLSIVSNKEDEIKRTKFKEKKIKKIRILIDTLF